MTRLTPDFVSLEMEKGHTAVLCTRRITITLSLLYFITVTNQSRFCYKTVTLVQDN